MEFQPRDTSIFLLPIFRQAHPSISSKYFKSPTPKELAIGRRRVEVTFSSSDRNLFRIRFQYLPMTDVSDLHEADIIVGEEEIQDWSHGGRTTGEVGLFGFGLRQVGKLLFGNGMGPTDLSERTSEHWQLHS